MENEIGREFVNTGLLNEFQTHFKALVCALYDDSAVSIVRIFSALSETSSSMFKTQIYWTCIEPKPHQLTLSQIHSSNGDILDIKTSRIGSYDAKHFTTDSITKSKANAKLKVEAGEFIASVDKDLQRILKNANLPLDLITAKIELNTSVFTNPNLAHLCCTPDGTAIIDGILCPVEVLTKIETGILLSVSSDVSIAAKARGLSKVDKIVQNKLIAAEKFKVLEAKKKKKKKAENVDSSFSIERSKKVPKASISQSFRSREGSISNLTDRSNAEKAQSRGSGQLLRRYVEGIPFIKESTDSLMGEKRLQIQLQMACMRCHKGILIRWAPEGIHYVFCTRNDENLASAALISRNFDGFRSPH